MKNKERPDTQTRILHAARDEFANYGLAGGRVDRIARSAEANVRMIYAHYGNKEKLFSVALNAALDDMAASVPLLDYDLPEWTGRLFDYYQAHPEALRIHLWRQLERPSQGHESTRSTVERVRAMSTTHVVTMESVDTFVLLFGLAQSWSLSPTVLLSADGSNPGAPERVQAHRRALVDAATVLCNRPWAAPRGSHGSAEAGARESLAPSALR